MPRSLSTASSPGGMMGVVRLSSRAVVLRRIVALEGIGIDPSLHMPKASGMDPSIHGAGELEEDSLD